MENLNILEQQAINAAINTHWQEAVALNLKIIQIDKKNIDAYLRLGFAYLQLKKIKEAKKCYQETLKIQPGNYTATENLERIKTLLEKKTPPLKKRGEKCLILDPNLFIEIPGRTKTVNLVNPGQKNILAQLTIGQQVFLRQKKRRIEIRSGENEYIGRLPDDLSRRLSILINAGSEFTAHIKEANLRKVAIFLQEVKRGKRVLKYLPFPTSINHQLHQITQEEEEHIEEEDEELTGDDLESLAEALTSQEKEDYLPFPKDEAEEVEEE